MVLFMDGAIVEFSQTFILYSKRKIQHHQKKLLEKQTKRFPTKLFDFLFHIVLKYTLLWKSNLSVFIKFLYCYAMLWTRLHRRTLSISTAVNISSETIVVRSLDDRLSDERSRWFCKRGAGDCTIFSQSVTNWKL